MYGAGAGAGAGGAAITAWRGCWGGGATTTATGAAGITACATGIPQTPGGGGGPKALCQHWP